MLTKFDQTLAPLLELWQRREALFEQRIIDWSATNLSPEQANGLIQMVRDSHSAEDVRNDVAVFITDLMQPATTNERAVQ
jgi:hypothetical protein